jgi:flotillin
MEGNDYLEQVVREQAVVADELRGPRQRRLGPAPAQSPPAAAAAKAKRAKAPGGIDYEEEEALGRPIAPAVDYRITGFWRWKTVVAPPNVYVVHTRRGHVEPLLMGLGVSFRYNPATDAFLVIPAAVQTLLINAHCISSERQGVLVQAYVQWVVDDLRTAYRKLDFSDPTDPMRIVNVQLREQAEAAIKDKVATMPMDEILSDKQPIIEELTHRLRAVAESSGEGPGATGLGLKIVTVQIKEAVVSSTRLWENLQKPFRAEREKLARLAELEAQQQIARQELLIRQLAETAQVEAQRRLDQLRAEQERESWDREQSEKTRRHQMEQEAEKLALAERAATEKARRLSDEELAVQQHALEEKRIARELESVRRQLELERAQAELQRQRSATMIERENLEHEARTGREEREVELFAKRRLAENQLSAENIKAQLIARLPEIAAALPQPQELRSVTVGGDGAASLTGLVAGLLQTVESAVRRGANGKEG